MTTRKIKGNDETPSAEVLIRILEDSYRGPAWHGASLRSILRGIDGKAAGLSLSPARPTIRELGLHIAYARHRMLVRLRPDARLKFPRKMKSSWWAIVSGHDASGWDKDLELLEDYQALLIAALRETSHKDLLRQRRGTRHTIGQELLGVALHDAYHAGQIRLTYLTKSGG